MKLGERSEIIGTICDALAQGLVEEAIATLKFRYPFEPSQRPCILVRRPKTRLQPLPSLTPRPVTVRRDLQGYIRTFLNDGFIDRYSSDRLIFPPVLRVVSLALCDSFPYHDYWKFGSTHVAYWEISATIDHRVPVTRGGADDPSNWFTTSMAQNREKGDWTLEELGWTSHEPGDWRQWDGLFYWFIKYTAKHPEALIDDALKQWHDAAAAVALTLQC